MSTGVIATEKSSNSKLGSVSSSMAAQQSCPTTCPFKGSGCYAEFGMMKIHTNRLNKTNLDPLTLAQNEAAAIANLTGKRSLRLHVVGDCTTDQTAKILAKAAKEHVNKHPELNTKVWSYTHGYNDVSRSSWGDVSILASTESLDGARNAMGQGYAAAIVMSEHKDTKAWMEDGIRVIPCPEQLNKATSCDNCKLCWNDKQLLKSKSVIAFAAHSQGAKKIQAALVTIAL